MIRTSIVPAVAALALAGLLAGCASDAADGGQRNAASTSPVSRQCFDPDFASGFSPSEEDRNKIFLTVGTRDVYELDTSGFCQNLDWSWQIGIQSRTGGRVCEGYDAEIIARSLGGDRLDRCAVTNVRKLSPEEVAAHRNRD